MGGYYYGQIAWTLGGVWEMGTCLAHGNRQPVILLSWSICFALWPVLPFGLGLYLFVAFCWLICWPVCLFGLSSVFLAFSLYFFFIFSSFFLLLLFPFSRRLFWPPTTVSRYTLLQVAVGQEMPISKNKVLYQTASAWLGPDYQLPPAAGANGDASTCPRILLSEGGKRSQSPEGG